MGQEPVEGRDYDRVIVKLPRYVMLLVIKWGMVVGARMMSTACPSI